MRKPHWPTSGLPSLRALLAFAAAARSRNFTLAAAELNLTPGAVSRQITQLEDQLGVRLFERQHHAVRLTPTGGAYLAEIRPAIELLAQATSRVRGRLDEQTVRVNSLPSFTLRWLIPRLSLFQQRHPDIVVRLDTTREFNDIAEEFDLSLRRPGPVPEGQTSIPLMKEFFVPVCSRQFAPGPLFGDGVRVPLIHMSRTMNLWKEWGSLAGRNIEYNKIDLKFDDWHYIIKSAESSLGIALAPAALVVDDISSGRLVPLANAHKLPAHPYLIIHPGKKAISKAALKFITWLREMGRNTETSYSIMDLDGNRP